MKYRILIFVYMALFLFLIISCLIMWPEKKFSVLWGVAALVFLYLLPAFLERLFRITFPPLLKLIVFLLLLLCVNFGVILSFYSRYYFWDNLVHFVSGIMTSTLALSVIVALNRDFLILKSLKPGFVLLFTVIFAMAAGLAWEYMEFFCDTFFHTNQMNDTVLYNGQIDIGLLDTMSDLLTSQVSALFMAVCYYHAIKKERWFKLSRVIVHLDR